MRESRLYGSVRGALSNGRPYRVVRRRSLFPDDRTKNRRNWSDINWVLLTLKRHGRLKAFAAQKHCSSFA